MFNKLGKTLVFVNLALSLLALTWALAIFLHQVDWGWKEPRKESDGRVPSEIDKRIVALDQAYQTVELVRPGFNAALAALPETQQHFPVNHLFYDRELQRLWSDPSDKLVVKEVKYVNGMPVVDAGGKGKPVLEKVVPEITKSVAGYVKHLKAVQQDIDKESERVAGWVEQEKGLTLRMIGDHDNKGKKVKLGLHDLVDDETKKQMGIRYEMEYVRPIWVRTLEEADLYLDRRIRLEETLNKLLKGNTSK